MGEEYDLSEGRPNRYAARYGEGNNVVLLDPGVREALPGSESVNRLLRALVLIINDRPGPT